MSSSNIRLPPRVPSRPHSAVNVLLGTDVATSNSEDGKFDHITTFSRLLIMSSFQTMSSSNSSHSFSSPLSGLLAFHCLPQAQSILSYVAFRRPLIRFVNIPSHAFFRKLIFDSLRLLRGNTQKQKLLQDLELWIISRPLMIEKLTMIRPAWMTNSNTVTESPPQKLIRGLASMVPINCPRRSSPR